MQLKIGMKKFLRSKIMHIEIVFLMFDEVRNWNLMLGDVYYSSNVAKLRIATALMETEKRMIHWTS
jgi:hypothetical protein